MENPANCVKTTHFDENYIDETTWEPEIGKTGFLMSIPAGNDTSAAKINLHVVGVHFDETVDHNHPEVIGGDKKGNVIPNCNLKA